MDQSIVAWWIGKNNKAKGSDIYLKKQASPLLADDGFWYALFPLVSDDTEDLTPGKFYQGFALKDFANNFFTLGLAWGARYCSRSCAKVASWQEPGYRATRGAQ